MTTNEDKGLKPGMWCKPESRDEWDCVVSLCAHLGFSRSTYYGNLVTRCFHWYNDTLFSCADASAYEAARVDLIPVPKFIHRMYEQAEINKKAKQDEVTEMTRAKGAPMVIAPMEAFDHEKRIKALEEKFAQESTKREKAYSKLKTNGDWIAQALTRIEKLEARPDQCDLRESQEAQRKYEYPLPPHSLIGFRKDASPKNISFSIALEYIKAGRKVKRASWNVGFLDATSLRESSGDALWATDIMADDWEVVPEQ